MVVEYIRYMIPVERAPDFEDAYRRAGAVLAADEHCLRHEISRGFENPDRYANNQKRFDGRRREFID
jgi:hemoglobin